MHIAGITIADFRGTMIAARREMVTLWGLEPREANYYEPLPHMQFFGLFHDETMENLVGYIEFATLQNLMKHVDEPRIRTSIHALFNALPSSFPFDQNKLAFVRTMYIQQASRRSRNGFPLLLRYCVEHVNLSGITHALWSTHCRNTYLNKLYLHCGAELLSLVAWPNEDSAHNLYVLNTRQCLSHPVFNRTTSHGHN